MTCAACAIGRSCLSAMRAGFAARDRRSRRRQGRQPRRRRLDRDPRRRPRRHLARKIRLARGRDRPRLLRPQLPVHALKRWLDFAGSIRAGLRPDLAGWRPRSRHAAQRPTRRAAGQADRAGRGTATDLPEKERLALYSGHSLGAGLATAAEVDERHVQKHLGHASAEMTRRYQRRRDRFRVNLSKAAGL